MALQVENVQVRTRVPVDPKMVAEVRKALGGKGIQPGQGVAVFRGDDKDVRRNTGALAREVCKRSKNKESKEVVTNLLNNGLDVTFTVKDDAENEGQRVGYIVAVSREA